MDRFSVSQPITLKQWRLGSVMASSHLRRQCDLRLNYWQLSPTTADIESRRRRRCELAIRLL